MYSSVVVCVFILLCSQSPELLHIANLELCTYQTPPISPSPQLLQLLFSYSLHGLDYSRFLIQAHSHSICLFVTGWFHLALWFLSILYGIPFSNSLIPKSDWYLNPGTPFYLSPTVFLRHYISFNSIKIWEWMNISHSVTFSINRCNFIFP